jgi:hypothetical protein
MNGNVTVQLLLWTLEYSYLDVGVPVQWKVPFSAKGTKLTGGVTAKG